MNAITNNSAALQGQSGLGASASGAALPPPRDEMSVSAVWGHLEVLRGMLGPKADVSASIWTGSRTDCAMSIGLYPEGLTGKGDRKSIAALSWPQGLSDAYAWARTRGPIMREAAIRRMALDIIDVTDAEGGCSAQALQRRGSFVPELVELACQRAAEMSAGAPFTVTGA
jgi:hypothetical protein